MPCSRRTSGPLSLSLLKHDRERNLLTQLCRSPIFYILEITLGTPAGATVLLVFFLYLGFVVLNAAHQTASRVAWAFARDNGLIKSPNLSTFHPKLQVPVYALLINGFLVGLVGVIYLISSSGEPLIPFQNEE